MENNIIFNKNTICKFYTNGGNGDWKTNGLLEILLIKDETSTYEQRAFVNTDSSNPHFKEYELNCKGGRHFKGCNETEYELIDANFISPKCSPTFKPKIKLYVKNDKAFALKPSQFYLDEFKIENDTYFKNSTVDTLPNNAYNIGISLTDSNDSFYIEVYKKYCPNKLKRLFFIYNNKTNIIQELEVIDFKRFRDGGTTDMILKDENNNEHHFHWATHLYCDKNKRHNYFDNIKLNDINITDELLKKINNSLIKIEREVILYC